MKKYMLTVSVVALAFSPAVFAQNEQPIVLNASSAWVADYAVHRCRIGNIFGEGDNRTVVFLEQYHPSNQLRWLVAGPYLKSMRMGREVSVRFGPAFDANEVRYDKRTFGDFGPALHGDWPPFDPEADDNKEISDAGTPSNRLDINDGAAIRWISIQRDGKPELRLKTGDLEPIYGAMNACMDDLVASWGLDPKQDRRWATAPIFTNRESVFRSLFRSYPNSALIRGKQADLHLRLMVDEDGKATECVVTDVTVAERFDDSACKPMLSDAEFEPARDRDGTAIPSYFTLFLYYRLS